MSGPTRISTSSTGANRPAMRRLGRLTAIGAVLLYVWQAQRTGQDVNWDRQNYHRYDVFALLHLRYARDVVPGGPQTFINPIGLLPSALLDGWLGPHAGQIALALLQSVAGLALVGIAFELATGLTAVTAALVGLTASMPLSEIGTSFDDVLLSGLVLFALLLLLTGRRALLAGLLAGAAAGCKLTMLPASLGVIAAATILAPASLQRVVLGTALGAAAAGGPWAIFLTLRFGNPMFPFLNDLFRSPDAAWMSFADPRFHYAGLLHAITLPAGIAAGGSPTSETPFRDLRPLAGLLAALAVLAVPPLRRRPELRAAACFLFCGEAAWMILCPIERYAAALDMVAGTLAIAAAGALARPAALVLAAAAILTTRTADFFHRPWPDTWVAHRPATVEPDADYLLLRPPAAYWVAASPAPAHAYALYQPLIEPGSPPGRRFDAGVARSRHLWALAYDTSIDRDVRREMGRRGLFLAPPCLRADSMYWIPTVFCRTRRSAPRDFGASDLATGPRTDFTTAGDGWMFELSGWDATGPDGTWAREPAADLVFHPTGAVPVAATLTLASFTGLPVGVDAGGRSSVVTLRGGSQTVEVCIGPERLGGGVVRVSLRARSALNLRLRALRLEGVSAACSQP